MTLKLVSLVDNPTCTYKMGDSNMYYTVSRQMIVLTGRHLPKRTTFLVAAKDRTNKWYVVDVDQKLSDKEVAFLDSLYSRYLSDIMLHSPSHFQEGAAAIPRSGAQELL